MLLFADFFPVETTWNHIQAAQILMETYGIPLRYYVDSLRIFRFIQGRDSVWRKHFLQTDEADPQWKRTMQVLGVEVIHALSPQAKGKIERPYGWMQPALRPTGQGTASYAPAPWRGSTTSREAGPSYEKNLTVTTTTRSTPARMTGAGSTTREIPSIRFARARKEGNSLFRPFALPKPYTSPKDVFCLRERRIVDAYRRISIFAHQIDVPKALPHEELELHLVPNEDRGIMDIRIWFRNQMLQSTTLPLEEIHVHF